MSAENLSATAPLKRKGFLRYRESETDRTDFRDALPRGFALTRTGHFVEGNIDILDILAYHDRQAG